MKQGRGLSSHDGLQEQGRVRDRARAPKRARVVLSAPGSFSALPWGRADASLQRSGKPSSVVLGVERGGLFELQRRCLIGGGSGPRGTRVWLHEAEGVGREFREITALHSRENHASGKSFRRRLGVLAGLSRTERCSRMDLSDRVRIGRGVGVLGAADELGATVRPLLAGSPLDGRG